MSFKELFSLSLSADPGRLHFAAHSHHLWPDVSYQAHLDAWNDAAELADLKWDKVMGTIWPAAQEEVAAELGTAQPDAIAFACNTHELLVRLFSALPMRTNIPVLTSDCEFHSARRQFARWEEDGTAVIRRVPIEPAETFSERFLEAAKHGDHALIFVSQVMFGSGLVFDRIEELARLGEVGGPWVVIDGYHAFMAIPSLLGEGGELAADTSVSALPTSPASATMLRQSRSRTSAFYLAGGYKYAMAGEGCAFMHAPDGFGPRPRLTGWFAEFDDLSLPPGKVGFANDARRFMGATFDPSGLYRFVAVRRMLRQCGLTTRLVSDHVAGLQRDFLLSLERTPLATAKLLNPLDGSPHARFLAFRSPLAQRWHASLEAQKCLTDVRGDVLRVGFALYHDQMDVERLIDLLAGLK